MQTSLVIVFMGALIFGALLANSLFDKTKIPNVLLLLLVGIIIGPILGFVRPEHFGSTGPIFSSITLIVILFESGITLKLKALIRAFGSASMLTILNFIAGAVLATMAAHYLGQVAWTGATFFGVIVAGTSSAVVIPIVNQLKLNEKAGTVLVLESALTDVLCLVIGLALLSAMSEGIVEVDAIAIAVVKSFAIACGIGIIAGITWSLILNKLRSIQNYTFTSLAFAFVVYGCSEYFGFNGGLSTLCFGIALANAYLFRNTFLRGIIPSKELLQTERSFFAELVFIVQTYFFVYVGVSIQFGNVWVYVIAALIIVAILAIRPFTIKLLVRNKELTLKDRSIMSVLSPKGLVPAILASLPLQMGLDGGAMIQDLTFSVVLISIVLCSALVIYLSIKSGDPDTGPLGWLFMGKSDTANSDTQSDIDSKDEQGNNKKES